jgi:hypothetical protein
LAIGYAAGGQDQDYSTIAIGYEAGFINQRSGAVAFGYQAGYSGQASQAVAFGYQAGYSGQKFQAVAIGTSAGQTQQGTQAIAIGVGAGRYTQGTQAIAIGYNAGQTQQFANSIVIDASGGVITATQGGFYVAPIRATAAASQLYYNVTSREITYLTSSASTKNTIEDLTKDTNVLYDLRPKTYIYNSDPGAGKQIGYIAEEAAIVEKHFAAYNEPNGPPVAIDYNTITVFLVEEVRKLKSENDDLKTRVLALENK